jgi:hypothetical protein
VRASGTKSRSDQNALTFPVAFSEPVSSRSRLATQMGSGRPLTNPESQDGPKSAV